MIEMTINQSVDIGNQRPRRLRYSPGLRRMVSEHHLRCTDLIYPLFVSEVDDQPVEIESMPGQFRWPVEQVAAQAEVIYRMGIPAVILFGIPAHKDAVGSDNFNDEGTIQRAIRAIKTAVPELVVISDVCFCEYTSHGHCGLVNLPDSEIYHPHLPDGFVLNDESLEILNRVAVSHARAGADIIAPSGMLDGMVGSIRNALDAADWQHIAIMSYSVKYQSAFYGPFRDAAAGTPQFGDRASHQMQPANAREALREAQLDIAEGADMLMVKPALCYLDIIKSLRDACQLPIVAYNVSGEYAMIKAAAARGWIDERKIVEEMLIGIKRAGADLIITYFAKEFSQWLKQN